MQIFFHILKPKGKQPTHALVFLHGYSSTGDLYMEFLADLVRRSGAMILLLGPLLALKSELRVPDLPHHGRSVGLRTQILSAS